MSIEKELYSICHTIPDMLLVLHEEIVRVKKTGNELTSLWYYYHSLAQLSDSLNHYQNEIMHLLGQHGTSLPV